MNTAPTLSVHSNSTERIRSSWAHPHRSLLKSGKQFFFRDLPFGDRGVGPGQLDKIVEHLARKFNLSESEAQQELVQTGIPILAEHCNVMVYNPQRWF